MTSATYNAPTLFDPFDPSGAENWLRVFTSSANYTQLSFAANAWVVRGTAASGLEGWTVYVYSSSGFLPPSGGQPPVGYMSGIEVADPNGVKRMTLNFPTAGTRYTPADLQIQPTPLFNGNDNITGSTGADIISTGPADDTINGNGGFDKVNGGAGNDVIYAYVGDLIDGGAGTNYASFSASPTGVSVVLGDPTPSYSGGVTHVANIQTLNGTNGSDDIRVSASAGSAGFTVISGDGDDTVVGGAGNDTIVVGHGNDFVDGGGGVNSLTVNTVFTFNGVVTLDLAVAGPQVTPVGTFTLANIQSLTFNYAQSTAQAVVLYGTTGNDSLTAVNGTLYGRDGDDVLNSDTGTAYGDAGNDTINAAYAYGGDGNDILSGHFVWGGAGDDTIHSGLGSNVYGEDGNDTITGIGIMSGGNGNDVTGGGINVVTTMDGGAGDDVMTLLNQDSAGSGYDVVGGGDGNDTLSAYIDRQSSTILDGGSGYDVLTLQDSGASQHGTVIYIDQPVQSGPPAATSVSNFERINISNNYIIGLQILGGPRDDTISLMGSKSATVDGGGGTNMIAYDWTTGGVTINLAAAPQTATSNSNEFAAPILMNFENAIGGAGADTLIGDNGANMLSGGAANDALYGQGGDDLLIGGPASAGGTNQLWGGTGIDTASYAGTTGAVYADLTALAGYVDGVLVDQMNSIENLTGGSGTNTLVGDAAANVLIGGVANDALYGQAGDDTLVGGGSSPGGTNQLWGGTGSDTASYLGTAASVSADLRSQAGYVAGVLTDQMNSIENLTGGSAGDVLVGDSAANVLAGAGGGDQLYGMGGANRFVYGGYADSNLVTGYDTIADFVSGTDKLDLAALHTTAAHVEIVSGGGSTSLYVEQTPGSFNAATDLAISFAGANAIAIGDIQF